MLDLLVFGLAAAITRRICHDADRDKQWMQKATDNLFQTCLFLSLLLFSLAILEAAPLSWMVLIYRSSILTHWYRILLWSICVLLLIIHPICLALAIMAQTMKLTSPSASSSQSQSFSRLAIIVQLIWTAIRFFFSIMWRFLLRKILKLILPVDFECSEHTESNKISSGKARGEGSTAWKQCCSCSAIALSLILVCFTFASLGAMKTVVIRNSNTNQDFADSTQPSSSPMKSMVTMICSFGLIVASVLNGFGSSSLPHSFLVGIFLKPTPSTTVSKAENDCYYAMSQLEEKECLLADVIQSSASAKSSSLSSFTSSLENKKIQQLQDEVMFLRSLVKDMNDDIHEMKKSQQLALRARTTIGRVRAFFGVVFSVILVVRVMLASKSLSLLLRDEQQILESPTDPVTSILLWLIGNNFVSEDQYDDLAQGTSLVLAGALSVSQVSSFLRVVDALGRKLNSVFGESRGILRAGKAGHFPTIMASHVMGSYFVSCVVVVKMNLPVKYRASFSSAIGFNFDFNTVLLNAVFFTSSITSAVILGLLLGIKRNHSARYHLESQLSTQSALSVQMA